MRKTGTTFAALALVAGAIVAAAPSATAASQAGTYTCAATWTPRMISDTSGSTRHRWTSTSTGQSKQYVLGSGVNATYGYAGANQWVLTASVIHSRQMTCTN